MEQISSESEKERVLIAGLDSKAFKKDQNADDDTLEELNELVKTAGGECVARVLQSRPAPDPKTMIGEGKAREIAETVKNEGIDLVVFDNELSPSQLRSLEEVIGCRVLDRSALILDIFAKRAKTNEGKLQVELAQYKYILPRLTGLGTTLSRQTASGGKSPIGTRGPGETKLETDRRHIRRRIAKLEEEVGEIKRVRQTQRRGRSKTGLPLVVIIGYTNVGKSTLLNMLTGSDIEANNRLFDTLDTTTRKYKVSDTLEVLMSDTVGFIRKLPHHLIDAFKATLEEIAYADLILHVVNAADPDWDARARVVDSIVSELKADHIPQIMVFNQCDRADGQNLSFITAGRKNVRISAKYGQGIAELNREIEAEAGRGLRRVSLNLPYEASHILDMLYRDARINSVTYEENGICVDTTCDDKVYSGIRKYL